MRLNLKLEEGSFVVMLFVCGYGDQGIFLGAETLDLTGESQGMKI